MITFGNTSIDIRLIAVFLTIGVLWLICFIVPIWFAVQGFRVHWGWGLANLLIPGAIILFCFLHPRESKKPLVLTGAGLGLFLILRVFAKHDGYSSPKVEVSPELLASATNAVLHLNLVTSSEASPTNWTQFQTQTISGGLSLKRPVIPAASSDSERGYDEERLMAIRADGFLMRFTKYDGGETQTNFILFPYGRTTETNILGWRITGNFN